MTIARRSRRDMQLGRWLRIGQRWRSTRDGSVWRVHQVHRKDCVVELIWEHGPARLIVPFEQLRTDWKWLATSEAPVAA